MIRRDVKFRIPGSSGGDSSRAKRQANEALHAARGCEQFGGNWGAARTSESMRSTRDELSAGALAAHLVQSYGHLIGGHDLVRISGCSSRRDLTMKAKAGRVGFRVFQIEGRSGAFALTQDIADWLWQLRSSAVIPSNVDSTYFRETQSLAAKGCAPDRTSACSDAIRARESGDR